MRRSCIAFTAVFVITVGFIAGIVGISTRYWLSVNDTKVEGGAVCNMGLWEVCCTISQDSCIVETRTNVEPYTNAMRVMLVIAVALVFITVLMLLFQIFSDKFGYSEGYQQITSLVMATGCLLYLMLVIAFGTKEYVMSEKLKEEAEVAALKGNNATMIGPAYQLITFGWSFYVTLVGALITPVGVCLVCTHWHSDEDKEAKEGNWTYDPEGMDTRF